MSAATDAILDSIRVRAPGVVDAAIELELFNVIDEFTRHSLQTTPPTRGSALATWLTDGQYAQYATLLIDGTLGRLLSQPGKPYTDVKLAAYHDERFQMAAARARDDASVLTSPSAVESLMDTLRVHLPNAKDGVIQLELFNTVNEFCRVTSAWLETIPVTLVVGTSVYDLTQAGKIIIDMVSVEHDKLALHDAVFDPDTDELTFAETPTSADVAYPLFVDLVFAPDRTQPQASWLPARLWQTHYDALLSGVLGRMMQQPAKPYSSPTLASYHLRRFRNFMALARADVATGAAADRQAWAFPPFA